MDRWSDALVTSSIMDFFGGIRLFSELAPDELNDLLRAMRPAELAAGHTVFHQGDSADSAYVVQEGHLEVFLIDDGKELFVATLGPGDIFGELALLGSDIRSATIRAKTACALFRIDQTEFDFLRRNLRPAAFKLIRTIAMTLCVRVRQTNQQITHFVGESDRAAQTEREKPSVEAEKIEPGHTGPRLFSRLSFWKNR